ncbi:MAG: selenocysteine-specific translation elongation factor [Thermoanaerobaculia bacterium]|nr:selenocysteine-specific translation elongation factor [Thermoanaerobaculia bacterium]
MDTELKRRVIGTAGHIDHGKTALVRSLTGVDCDRLPEEKERGITIDLGFASFREAGLQIGFIDVPGHERFVKNMLAGVGGIDAVLFVVAADESIKPQSREHFDICRLLRIPTGLIAITKTDLVEPDIVELVRLEVEDLVAGSFLEGAPILPVSSETGDGLDLLRSSLVDIVRRSEEGDSERKIFRLPVDRTFTLRGFGSIVTGTTISGSLSRDETVELLPGGKRSRARSIQVHSEDREVVSSGERTSVNVSDLSLDDIARGQQLVEPDTLSSSSVLTVEIELLDSAKPLKDDARIRFHLYSEEAIGRVRHVGTAGAPLRPGSDGFAQIRLDAPVVAVHGDRFVLRSYSPSVTIGGGKVLDPHLPKLRRNSRTEALETLARGSLEERIIQLARLAGLSGISLRELERRTGVRRDALQAELPSQIDGLVKIDREPQRWIHERHLESFRRRAMKYLREHFETNRTSAGLPRGELVQKLMPGDGSSQLQSFLLADLEREGIAVVSGDLLDVPGRSKKLAGEEGRVADRVEREFLDAGLSPPTMSQLVQSVEGKNKIVEGVTQYLVKTGKLVRLADGLFLHRDVVSDAKSKVEPFRGEKKDVAFFKDLFGLSRKVAIPLLEHFDQAGVTRRIGDQREVL